MQIFVQNLSNETSTLELESSASVLSVKRLLEAREDIPAEEQLLTFAGKDAFAALVDVHDAGRTGRGWGSKKATINIGRSVILGVVDEKIEY